MGVVAARHLPEWIDKDASFVPEKRPDPSAVRDTDLYRACRDIADASKHFELTTKRSAERLILDLYRPFFDIPVQQGSERPSLELCRA